MGAREYVRARIRIEDRGHSSPCWTWQLSLDAYGYAQGWPPGHKVCKIHRYAYEAFVGPIPDGLVSDHLCRNRSCVNPAHIEPITNAENVRRGRAALKWTHCKKGHSLAGDGRTPGSTTCRVCKREWYLEHRAKILAGMKAKRAAARNIGTGGVAPIGQRPTQRDTIALHAEGAL